MSKIWNKIQNWGEAAICKEDKLTKMKSVKDVSPDSPRAEAIMWLMEGPFCRTSHGRTRNMTVQEMFWLYRATLYYPTIASMVIWMNLQLKDVTHNMTEPDIYITWNINHLLK